jgi:hypothetical protein
MFTRAVPALCALTFAAASTAAQSIPSAASLITVGPNAHVSRARALLPHNEVLIDADPSDPNRLIACSSIGRGSAVVLLWTVAYKSSDGGSTWSPAVTDSAGSSGDPACVFGPGGRAYFTALRGGLRVFYSADAGQNWKESDEVPSRAHVDREYVVVDHTNGRYHGRVYVYAARRGDRLDGNRGPWGMALWRSLDSGATFGHPVQQFPGDASLALLASNGVILSDGTFAALVSQLFDERNGRGGVAEGPASKINGVLKLITSSDGGETLNAATKVDSMYADWRWGSSIMPVLGVDATTGPFKDRLYAVWADGRFGGRTQILISVSSDKGKTWSPAKIVNDDRRAALNAKSFAEERSALMPAAAVNRAGVVGVSWYDRRDNGPTDLGYTVRFAASVDGGETFTPSVKLSERTLSSAEEPLSTYGAATRTASGVQLWLRREEWDSGGDTQGLAVDAGGDFHPLWVDNRTGIHQVWTTRVAVRGSAVKNGDPALADLDDVSAKVSLELTGSSFDPATRAVTFAARLRNTSKDTVRGPFELRALTIQGASGIALAENADLGGPGDGAVWHFTKAVKGDVLPPGGVSEPRSLSFRITLGRGEQFTVPPQWSHSTIIQMDAKVLAHGRSERMATAGATPP